MYVELITLIKSLGQEIALNLSGKHSRRHITKGTGSARFRKGEDIRFSHNIVHRSERYDSLRYCGYGGL